MKQRSFPAVVIATLLLVVCYFPAQGWLTHAFPNISGRATLDPGLTIFDIPIKLPYPIDLILVPGLFLILYSIAILILSSGPARWPILVQRLGAVATSMFFLSICTAIGSLLSWLIRDHLSEQIRTGMRSIAVNADLHLPYAGYPTIHLFGDTLSLLGLLIGIVISIRIISKAPRVRANNRLTREQRMTPYQRMLLERRYGTPPPIIGTTPPLTANAHLTSNNQLIPNHAPIQQPTTTQISQPTKTHPPQPTRTRVPHPTVHPPQPSHGLCRTEPLHTLQPEAVNFRPLG